MYVEVIIGSAVTVVPLPDDKPVVGVHI
jgi:hypothetical protein